MSKGPIPVTKNIFARVGICLLGTVAVVLPVATASDAKADFHPVVIRGTGAPASNALSLVYLASFLKGSLAPSIDTLNFGPMVPGDPLIPDSNPTVTPLPGEILLSIHRPVGLPDDLIPSESIWTQPVHFGPGSIIRIRSTFIRPVGPLPGGGFAIGVNARTGAKDDLASETRVAATVNVRPDFLVRFGAPFGSTEPARVVLTDTAKNAIFSTTDPQPFTIDLRIDRVHGTATAKLMVVGQVFTVPFVLSDFRADSGPVITAVGPGIAVNANAPGQTASVRVQDFRIYTDIH